MIENRMQIKLSRVTIPAGSLSNYSGELSLLYLLSGNISIKLDHDEQSMQQGDGKFIPTNKALVVQVGLSGPAELIHYQLTAASNTQTAAFGTPAITTELHRMAMPQTLKPGPHELSLTRVTIPAGSPRPRAHTRSGAALYYVISEGSITFWPSATIDTLAGESQTEIRKVGAVQEEPFGFIHSWSPKPDSALVLLQANITQEGAPEIIFAK
jgi:hypothetical protein